MSLRLALAVYSCLLAPAASARTWDDVARSRTLRVATEGAFRPFNFFEGKQLKGFEVELAEELARRLGLKVEWTTLSFESLLIGLNQGRYDFVMASHGITPEREKAVDFLSPHYCTGAVIVSGAGGASKTEAQLAAKTIGVPVGTTYFQHLKALPGLGEIKTYPKDNDALQALLQGRIDVWVTDRFLALDASKAQPKGKVQLGDILFPERIGGAVAKGNGALRAKLDEALRGALKDGFYRRLSLKYFGQDIRCR